MKLNQIKFTGGYKCPHFLLKKAKGKRWCCGGNGDEYIPTCRLDNNLCSGLVQCLKLNVIEKSELIKKWREDLQSQVVVDGSKYVE